MTNPVAKLFGAFASLVSAAVFMPVAAQTGTHPKPPDLNYFNQDVEPMPVATRADF